MRHLPGVAGDHGHLDAACLQGPDGLAGLGPHGILEADSTQDPAAVHDMEHRCAALQPGAGRGGQLRRLLQTQLPEQGRTAHLDRAAVDRGADSAAGQRREPVRRRKLQSPFPGGGND
ncbi:hypothetical protein SRABI128_02654 [Microbacterium sp. Bi128]|nr:hypothetical protein SRABI128_02654 [Microbacterium sp. Bi128]